MTRSGLIALLMVWLMAACQPPPQSWHSKSIQGLLPDLAFELTDEQGRPVTEADYRGKIKLVFFGFSHCAHACPMTLQKLGQAVSGLPRSHRSEVRVLFISVDPERDSPDRLKRYTAHFGDRVIGLTGSHDQLRPLHKRLRITYGYGETGPDGHYDVSHASAVYLFDRAGRALELIKGSAGPDTVRERVSERLPPAAQ